jgi:hypothetical protein
MIRIKAPASWRSWIELELKLKRKWNDGTESLVFTQRDFVERLAGVIPPAWFNLTRFHAYLPQITRGESLWYPVQRRNELAQPLMSLTTLIHHQPANPQLDEHPQSFGFHGLSFFAERSAWIPRSVSAAQE